MEQLAQLEADKEKLKLQDAEKRRLKALRNSSAGYLNKPENQEHQATGAANELNSQSNQGEMLTEEPSEARKPILRSVVRTLQDDGNGALQESE